ncbi:MAG: serine hydrolase [Anaerolineaceae bacterium]
MKTSTRRSRVDPLRWLIGGFGLFFLLFSLFILLKDYTEYRASSRLYPGGVSMAQVPIGGLTREQAEQRLKDVFGMPVELRYNRARMQFLPGELGFSLDTAASLDALDRQIPRGGWWRQLWGQSAPDYAQDFPLQASLDTDAARAFLSAAIQPRYDQPASEALPILYSTNYAPGQPGYALDLEAALTVLEPMLFSASNRTADLPVRETPALGLNPANLEVFLRQTILLDGFDGLVEIYLQPLSGEDALHFAVRANQTVPPDVAYSAASTIKIPIMTSVLKHLDEPTPDTARYWMERMIIHSENPPGDALMSTYLDENLGPLIVTEDMRALGYQNTFLAGYFYSGAPLLQRFSTPANSRTDVYLDPDFYNQTVPSEIGDLLARIVRCSQAADAQDALFAGQVSRAECQTMLDLLGQNKIGALIEAGLPPEASAAHKHGWTSDLDGLLHTMSDAAVVSTPGGDYVLIIFINSSRQLVFDEGNWLFARLSQVIYNAYNLQQQAAWLPGN